MPTMDPQAPATKLDVQLLMQEVAKTNLGIEDLHRHFDVAVELIKSEAFSSQKDKLSLHDDRLESHEQRILALERK